jgi:hypothetical protein
MAQDDVDTALPGCPHRPIELWTNIFLYTDCAHLWYSYRVVPKVSNTGVEFVLRTQYILRLTGVITNR